MSSKLSFTYQSRRNLLAATGAIGLSATAGCLGVLGSESDDTQIEPAEPPIEREGTPAEFYYFLEQNGIGVEKLEREDDDLYLTYRSGAETTRQSNDEIVVVYEVYKQALIQRGSDVDYLYTEIADPFDGQAHGWGINTEWIRDYDSQDAGSDNESATDGGNESESGTPDSDTISLWNMIENSKVYGDDGEGADGAPIGNGTTNESETVDANSTD